jgi:hypothetical protein
MLVHAELGFPCSSLCKSYTPPMTERLPQYDFCLLLNAAWPALPPLSTKADIVSGSRHRLSSLSAIDGRHVSDLIVVRRANRQHVQKSGHVEALPSAYVASLPYRITSGCGLKCQDQTCLKTHVFMSGL